MASRPPPHLATRFGGWLGQCCGWYHKASLCCWLSVFTSREIMKLNLLYVYKKLIIIISCGEENRFLCVPKHRNGKLILIIAYILYYLAMRFSQDKTIQQNNIIQSSKASSYIFVHCATSLLLPRVQIYWLASIPTGVVMVTVVESTGAVFSVAFAQVMALWRKVKWSWERWMKGKLI